MFTLILKRFIALFVTAIITTLILYGMAEQVPTEQRAMLYFTDSGRLTAR